MISLSNSLSLLRAPLAFLFLVDSVHLRLIAIVLAMLTDSVDGFFARLSKTTSRFGAVLDPAMDKFFVFFALIVLLIESKIGVWPACAMVSRDVALCIFGVYLSFSGKWKAYKFRAIRWGKITTALQFLILIVLTLGYTIPLIVFGAFVVFALLGLYELFQFKSFPA